ncbi:MAG: hypothetical protein LBI28_02980 [Treponema sp.]|jgi:hypothetical protein|nr:hypothetical protein [Treponema sp.]
MKIGIISLIISFFIVNIAYATPQETDDLLYNGKYYPLLQFPLEGYFYQNPHKRPIIGKDWSSTWRRYTALFEIKNKKFYVTNMSDFDSKKHLKWWNGMLIIPDGELMLPVREIIKLSGRYETLKYYDYYKFIEIKKGKVKNEYRLNNDQYRKYDEIIFYLYSKTEAYKEIYSWRQNEYELNTEILPNEIVEYVKINYEANSCFFDFIPVIYYNYLLSIEFIDEYVKNHPKKKPNRKLILLIIGFIGIIILPCAVHGTRLLQKAHNNI